MCRVASNEFDASVSSSQAARNWVSGLLKRWELMELVEPAKLLVSELVTNAVLHASSKPFVVAAVVEGGLEVGVSDREPRLPPKTVDQLDEHDLDAEHGRGLMLVEALADEWGAASLAGGKQIWFRLKSAAWPYRGVCGCAGPSSDRVRLKSGSYALAMPGPWDEH